MLNATLNEVLAYWPHISTLGGLAMVALMWRMRSEFATTSSVSGLSAEVNALTLRVERVERDVGDLPKREDIHSLQIAMTEIKGALGEMRAEARGDRDLLARVEHALARHEDIIATGGRRS